MNSSELDSDTEAVERSRLRQQNRQHNLFKSSTRDLDASSSPPPPAQVSKSTTLKTRRPAPRFLGDSEDEENGGDRSAPHHRFFDEEDLDDVSNKAPPRRLDADAFERMISANGNGNGGATSNFGGAAITIMDVDGVDGVDGIEGVAAKKKRVIAKMNDERLLGPNGFPALQKDVMKFKFKGKGKETQDLQRVMSMYQLWAHQMYPKTNLFDTLHTVEKLCHKRSVHRALKEYRDLAKNGPAKAPLPEPIAPINSDEPLDELHSDGEPVRKKARSTSPSTSENARQALVAPVPQAKESGKGEDEYGFDEDDDLYGDFDEEALMAAQTVPPKEAVTIPAKASDSAEDEWDEEADALLREME